MFKHLLSTSSGDINWMAMFALVTFFIIFSVVLFRVFLPKSAMWITWHNSQLGDDHDQTSKTINHDEAIYIINRSSSGHRGRDFCSGSSYQAAAPAQPNSFNWAYNNIF